MSTDPSSPPPLPVRKGGRVMAWLKKYWELLAAAVIVILLIVYWSNVRGFIKTRLGPEVEQVPEKSEKETPKKVADGEVTRQLKDVLRRTEGLEEAIQALAERLSDEPDVSSEQVAQSRKEAAGQTEPEPFRLAPDVAGQPVVPSPMPTVSPEGMAVQRPLVVIPQKPLSPRREEEEALVRRIFNLRESVENRRQAVQALADYHWGRVAKVLAEKILPGDPSPVIRKEAARSLGKVANEHFLPVLQEVAANPKESPEMRREAAIAINRIQERTKKFWPSPPHSGY